jgi:hypothetical protein
MVLRGTVLHASRAKTQSLPAALKSTLDFRPTLPENRGSVSAARWRTMR